ncbi:uncharacterized protein K452DRAFT_356215 [Aplosporella prunicola CBS 121167]|uniref:Calcium-dependent cell adhesion molecule N-terminal domain-containing protein n=1 Tax=Aplosporella prunicola CBS 121167 TaxID=1176127 RepID=A0A6A6BMF7_9PEZI|nr:uncharacterized protein K452DRAFT_356215 [Aplosporella prunicola CBS 121167]KAF2144838.1 hypothetical protein K452DRAFT_356215 [Aplosporella prunicola CBS 121167]
MHTIQLATACLAIAGCVFAAPATQVASKDSQRLSARATYWIKFYKDGRFTGDNLFLENQVTGVCYNLPGNWNDKMSSVQVSDGHSCRYWKDNYCTGSVFGGNDQDWADLPTGFNDKVTSWRCS